MTPKLSRWKLAFPLEKAIVALVSLNMGRKTQYLVRLDSGDEA